MQRQHLLASNIKALFISVCSLALLSGCVVHVGGDGGGQYHDRSEFQDVRHSAAGKNVSAVNRRLQVDDHSQLANLDNVNGNIMLGEHVSIRTADNVNGDIHADAHFAVERHLTTVNGDISVGPHGKIDGRVETVNGDITLKSTEVGQSLVTYNGDIELKGETHIRGDIVYERSRKTRVWLFPFGEIDFTPELKIRRGVKVDGEIILNREVKVDIEDSALLAKVQKNYSER